MNHLYSAWVRAMLECVRPLCEPDSAYKRFPEPETDSGSAGDYAVLRDAHAAFFLELLERYAAYAPVDMDKHRPQYRQTPDGGQALRYAHSCYARNLRRWACGTVSRKRICRTEFAVLCACWALAWGGTEGGCREAMIAACRTVCPQECAQAARESDEALVRLIALASETAYRQSF